MKKQFSGVTFFDKDIDNKTEDLIRPVFYQQNQGKKRLINNSIIVRYLNKEQLTIEELQIAKKIISGELFIENKNKYGHCKLCSNSFSDYTFNSISNNTWQIGLPTQPYTPFGLMIYLTNRKESLKENFYNLSQEEFYSLVNQIIMLYEKIKKSDFKYEIVGINVLFNQLNVSQRCIHGHIEPMIYNVDKLGLGCKTEPVKEELFEDTIRLKINNNYYEVMELIKFYSDITKEEIANTRKLQDNYRAGITVTDVNSIESISPAPTINIYITYYRDNIYLTLSRDLYQKPMLSNQVYMNDSFIYNLKYNMYFVNEKSKLLYQEVPIIRPSIKVNDEVYGDRNIYNDDLNNLKRILSK